MYKISKILILSLCLVNTGCGSGYFQFSDTPLQKNGEWVIDFDNHETGDYSGSQQRLDWHNPRWQMGRNLISVSEGDEAYSGKALKITYPKGISSCPNKKSCVNWPVDLGVQLDSLYYGYRFKLNENFDYVQGGKFPGIAGGSANNGGNVPNGKDGWSVRMMWDDEGKLVQYVYHPDQPGKWGDVMHFAMDDQPIKRGVWHTVQTYVQLNTPGKKDGRIESWVNGEKVLSREGMRFRDDNNLKIDRFQFVSFFGGHGPDWAPSREEFSYIDDVRMSLKPPFFEVSP